MYPRQWWKFGNPHPTYIFLIIKNISFIINRLGKSMVIVKQLRIEGACWSLSKVILKEAFNWPLSYYFNSMYVCKMHMFILVCISISYKNATKKLRKDLRISAFCLSAYCHFRHTSQNLHWKLGQQTPSVGSLLAYLETTA